MNYTPFIIVGIVIAVLLLIYAGLMVYMKWQKKKRNNAMNLAIERQAKNSKNHLYFLKRIYVVTPVISRYYTKLKNKYRAILPADEVTLDKKTTNRMTFCLGVCIAVYVFTCILCKGDLMYAMAGLLICYILFTHLVNTSEEKLQMLLLEQLDTFISDIHSYYHETGMVDEAISMCMEDLPYEINLHANKIYHIVTAVDTEAEVEKYVETAPNNFLLLLSAICASIKEHGDTVLENGRSLFIQNLDYLSSELNMERIRMKKRVLAFSGKTISVLAPIFCLKPLELWFNTNFPDTAEFFEGAAGVITMVIILVTTFICYEAINALKDDYTDTEKDNRFFRKITEVRVVKNMLKQYTEKHYTKVKKFGDSLKAVGDKSGTNVFLVKRIAVAVLLFVLVNVVAFVGIGKEKNLIISDFSSSYEDSLIPNEEYRETMREVSMAYRGKINDAKVDRAAIIDAVTMELGDSQYAEMVADEIVRRNEAFKKQYYKWWVLILALIAAVIGYFIPLWLLNYKKKIRGMSREDEVAQFRTLILILMHQDGMRLDDVLEWMERFAHAFRPSISNCILNLEYSQQEAIETMREEEAGFAPFRRLCDRFLIVDNVGIKDAFDDLETEREYFQEKRKLDNETLLYKCIRKANKIQMIPIWEIIILRLLIPFGMYAINMMSVFSSMM